MNRRDGLSLRSSGGDTAYLRMIRGETPPSGRILTPQTSHEGNWCQASIALPHRNLLPLPYLVPAQPSLVLFPTRY